MSNELLITLAVIGPVFFAGLAWVAPQASLRSAAVLMGSLLTALVGGGLALRLVLPLIQGQEVAPIALPAFWGAGFLGGLLEVAIGALVLGLGWKRRNWLIGGLGATHLLLLLVEGIAHLVVKAADHAKPAMLVLDPLAGVMLGIVSVVGALIVIFGLGYMKHHEHHAPATAASTGRFFFFLLGFLGVMNGLVVADDLRWLGIFWECTTLCSFFLISHDGTAEAKANGARALIINGFGGLALLLAGVWIACAHGSPHLAWMIRPENKAIALAPLALLALAGFTKSAQLPFQSWLLGAMVAPTPVSALLHSATLVKAGSYLILRLAPAFSGEKVIWLAAVAGGLTFAVAAALAVTQSNAKKVLAYSTISNLGLIVACAGINTSLAFAAALMVLVFHAVSKALLFCCVGTIEQEIGSRDIEDMGNLMWRMPATAWMTVIGMVSMLAPPFGMLLAKWIGLEAAGSSPILFVLLALGSALSVWFWCKWLGRLTTSSYHTAVRMEHLPVSVWCGLGGLALLTVVVGLDAMVTLRQVLAPISHMAYGEPQLSQTRLTEIAQLNLWPILAAIGVAVVATLVCRFRTRPDQVRLPYLCGENVPIPSGAVSGQFPTYRFRSAGDQVETAWTASHYARGVLNEMVLTQWSNLIAALILLAMLGVLHRS